MGKPFQAEELTRGANSKFVYVCVKHSAVSDSVTLWTVACQVPLSMEFSRPEYWSGLPFPPPGGLPHSGTEPRSPTLQADSLSLSHKALKSVSLEQRAFRSRVNRVLETSFLPGPGCLFQGLGVTL